MPVSASRDQVRHAKASLAERLKSISGITSLGIGKSTRGEYVVRVTVLDGKIAKMVPSKSEGVPVEVSVSGEFGAL